MALCTADFELGTNGATVAAADPGNATQWSSVTIVAGGTLAYDSTRAAAGSQSCKVATGGTAGGAYAAWIAPFGTNTDHYGRIYGYFTGLPANNNNLVQAVQSATTAAVISVQAATGKIFVADSSGSNKGQTGNAITPGQWFRVEYHVIHSATVGQIEIKLFLNPNAATPTETVTTPANLNTLANADRIRIGYSGALANIGPFWMDAILAGATSYPGPAGIGASGMLLLDVA